MTFFTQKMLQEYVAPLNRLIDLQTGIISQKEEQILVLKTENDIMRANYSQIQLENNQLKDRLALSQESQADNNKELEPIFTRNEPWTVKRQRLEREDRQSPEVVAERMRLEQHWRKRNEEIDAIEKRNA